MEGFLKDGIGYFSSSLKKVLVQQESIRKMLHFIPTLLSRQDNEFLMAKPLE
jgi:hypothetical protein